MSDVDNQAGIPPAAATLLELKPQQRKDFAEQYLRNPLFNEIIDNLTLASYKAWLSSKPGETDKRERIWATAFAFENLRNDLTIMLQNGRLDLEHQRKITTGEKR